MHKLKLSAKVLGQHRHRKQSQGTKAGIDAAAPTSLSRAQLGSAFAPQLWLRGELLHVRDLGYQQPSVLRNFTCLPPWLLPAHATRAELMTEALRSLCMTTRG